MKFRKLIAKVLLLALMSGTTLMIAAPPAHAGLRGEYQCWYSPTLYWGFFKLKANGNYTSNGGPGGKYSYKASTKKLNFKTGPLRYFFGKRDMTEDGWYFKVRDKDDREYVGYCFQI